MRAGTELAADPEAKMSPFEILVLFAAILIVVCLTTAIRSALA